jgi:hypothetical protein
MHGPGRLAERPSGNFARMNRAEVIATAFVPTPAGVVSPPTQDASAARRLRDAIEPIAMHSVWCEGTSTRLGALGLDFFESYVTCRASLLGEPEPGVVVATFAVFEPTVICAVYETGRSKCGRVELLAARDESTIASLSAALTDVDTERVGTVADVLLDAVVSADGTGRPLFSGLRDQPVPAGAIGRLWRACELIREHRGDSHVAVCVAAGLSPVAMNILTELWVGMPIATYSASRFWSVPTIEATCEDLRSRGWLDGDQLSESGRTMRDQIESATDELQGSIIDSLVLGCSDDAAVEGLINDLADWSQRCIGANAFPPDVFKRAAG